MPRVDLETAPKVFAFVHEAVLAGLVRSCHDLSEGGLAVAAAEMSFAGELGLEMDLAPQAAAFGIEDAATLLFAESNSRFLMEVPPEHAAEFTALAQRIAGGDMCIEVGSVADHHQVRIAHVSHGLIDAAWSRLKSAWQQPLIR